ncbi:plasmid mobilization protein [Hymenobacter cavernae]|uniref:Plasmid mobilization relaxosome protein MobC n=1 Tax=Hymenobacter cavernae TaxID=2044852 RepID=A0ABQ1UVL9_9BACT|nr:plasmid mobilization relaxosome protein MobC [Hymenobacter cavernae]GGF27230.1 hypothetical protein GCM10011383_43590 [Hymenobacter cavernae]
MEEPDVPELAPESSEELLKDAHINVRITSVDKKTIEQKAAKAGLTTGDYVRRAALGKKIGEKVPRELRNQMAGAANNLNQLARLANAGKLGSVGGEKLTDLANRLLELLK